MPILDLQQRFRELGRIRLGHKGDKGQPVRSLQFRFTSANLELLAAAAKTVGGQARPWQGAPQDEAYELFTQASSIEIMIPPGQVLTQWMELWKGGGCQRRCDLVTENIQMRPCVCPKDERGRVTGDKGDVCDPTTRLNVILPWLPGLGVWRLETHGWNAAEELAGVAQLLAVASQQGRAIPARLAIESRFTKKPGEPRKDFIVPVLDVDATIGDVLQSIGAIAAPGMTPAPALEPGRRGTQRIPIPELAPPLPGDPTFQGLQEQPIDASPRRSARSEPGHGRSLAPPASPAPAEPPPPPMPAAPTPADELPPEPINQAQVTKVVMACKDAGLDDEGRHDLVGLVTRGRTFSSKDLTKAEMDQVLVLCDLIAGGHARLEWKADGGCQVVRADGAVARFPVDVAATRAWMEQQSGGED